MQMNRYIYKGRGGGDGPWVRKEKALNFIISKLSNLQSHVTKWCKRRIFRRVFRIIHTYTREGVRDGGKRRLLSFA